MAESRRIEIVPIGQMAVSNDPKATLATHALGSCIGLSLYDPVRRIGGLAHCMLPLSSVEEDASTDHPCMFVDTGVVALLRAVLAEGADKARLELRATGAAELLGADLPFRIGKRNRVVLSRILIKNNLALDAYDLGGQSARTMALQLDDGTTIVRKNGLELALHTTSALEEDS